MTNPISRAIQRLHMGNPTLLDLIPQTMDPKAFPIWSKVVQCMYMLLWASLSLFSHISNQRMFGALKISSHGPGAQHPIPVNSCQAQSLSHPFILHLTSKYSFLKFSPANCIKYFFSVYVIINGDDLTMP